MSSIRPLLTLSLCLTAFLAASAPAAVLRDEAIAGDISGDRIIPSRFVLTPGSNEIIATTGGDDLEYFSFTSAFPINQLFLRSYSGTDGTAFIAVQNGGIFTEAPAFPDQANLRGYAHFGPDLNHVGQDILPAVGNGAGSQGFAPPLAPGQYTFWVQQTGSPSTYRLDFITVPEPSSALVAAGLAFLTLARRRPIMAAATPHRPATTPGSGTAAAVRPSGPGPSALP